jgi:hypothetical protein
MIAGFKAFTFIGVTVMGKEHVAENPSSHLLLRITLKEAVPFRVYIRINAAA